MSDSSITPIVMPKWGLSMKEGRVVDWLVEEGADIAVGDEILEVETDKIAGAVEATGSGRLRRIVAQADEVHPVGDLLAVLADEAVADADIDHYVQDFQANFTPPEDDADSEQESAYQFIEVDGQRLRYTRQGDGAETVLLLHGFGGDLDNWLFNLQALAEQYTVYALDLPGHGQSEKALADASLAGLAASVRSFMDAVGIDQAHLVGHSMGGAVALQLAREHPERVQSLSLIGSAGLGEDINRDYLEGFISANSRRQLKPHVQQLFADPDLVTRQLLDDLLKYKRLDGVAEALQTLADELFREGRQQQRLADTVSTERHPILVIWGEADRIIPADHARQAPAGARIEIIDGAGHMVQMEVPGEINRLLIEHFSTSID